MSHEAEAQPVDCVGGTALVQKTMRGGDGPIGCRRPHAADRCQSKSGSLGVGNGVNAVHVHRSVIPSAGDTHALHEVAADGITDRCTCTALTPFPTPRL